MKRLPWLLLLAALLLPGLALVPESQHAFWAPESVVGLVLAPLAALLAWWSTRRTPSPALPVPLLRTFWFLAALWILAALGAERRDLSLLSVFEWLSYPLLFFAVWRLADSAPRRRELVSLLLAYSALSSLYAGLQVGGWDAAAWTAHFNGRSGAFFGNPNFLGGHLALLLPLGLALALDQRRWAQQPWRQRGAWVVVILLGLGLLFTQTRGAWISAFVGAMLVLVAAQRSLGSLGQRNARALAIVAGLGLLSAGLFFYSEPDARARVGATVTGEDQGLSRRFFLMGRVARLAVQHPLLGVGPGNLRLQFPRVQAQGLAPEDYAKQPYVVSEHAHDDLIQMAAEAGPLAALLWFALLALLFRELWHAVAASALARGPQQGRLLALGALGGLVALTVHGLANFPFLILPTQGVAWALAAIALRANARPAAVAIEGLIEDAPTKAQPSAGSPGLPPVAAKGLFAVGLALIALNVAFQIRRLDLDRLWWFGQGELQLQHPVEAEPWLRAALLRDRHEDRLWALLGEAQLKQGRKDESLESLRTAQRLAPADPEIAMRLGRALLEAQQYPAAVGTLQAAYAQAPNFADVGEVLGAAQYLKGDYAAATQVYGQLIQTGLATERVYENQAAAQGSQGHLVEALQTLQAAQARYPHEPKVYVNEAITYLKLGRRAEAREALKQAEALGFADPQVAALQKALR